LGEKSGFTLIELLVYMAIMGFIIVVAGRAFSDSTSMRIRSQNMLNSAEEAGRVSAILKEDISQMGAKVWKKPTGDDFDTAKSVQMSNTDKSSFILTKGDGNAPDRLKFRKAHYAPNGVCDAVLEIEWYVDDNNNLIRKCEPQTETKCTGSYNRSADCPAEVVEMASNVTQFKFTPSKPGRNGNDFLTGLVPGENSITLFPQTSPNTTPPPNNFKFIKGNTSGGVSLPPSGEKFYKNKNEPPADVKPDKYLLGDVNGSPFSYNFKAGEEYAIEFNLRDTIDSNKDLCITGAPSCGEEDKINKMAMFQTGRDHLSVGLRRPSNGSNFSYIPDFLFYPPQQNTANDIKRHFTFSVPIDTIARIGITVAIYSDEVDKGHLDFRNFKVYRKIDRVYHFEDGYTPADNLKYTVKAFKLEFDVGKGGETTKTSTVIHVPSNGIAGGS
jgi:prepilin-type N-terminal cleavage/methylation domain-containing protein